MLTAPIAFDVLTRPDAARFVSRLFAGDAVAGIVLGLLLFVVALQRARLDADDQAGSRFSTDMLLALGALFCVVAGHYGVQPWMQSARQGAAAPSFAVLHGLSLAFFVGKAAAAAALAWRLTRAAATSAAPTS